MNFYHNIKLFKNIQFLRLWLGLMVMALLLSFYINLRNSSQLLLEQLENQTAGIVSDLNKIQDNYFKQLLFTKNALEKSPLTEKNVKKFLKSQLAYILDYRNIGTVIVTDENYRVIYADQFKDIDYHDTWIDDRDYKKEVAQFPDQIIAGNVVEGVLTKKPAIPIVVGLKNKAGQLNGVLIFSVNLANLALSLKQNNLSEISFVPLTGNSIFINNSYQLKTAPLTYFLFNVLPLSSLTKIKFAFENSLNNNLILLTYDLQPIQKEFWISFLPHAIIILLVFLIIGIVFYYYIFKPLLPIIKVTNPTPTSTLPSLRHDVFIRIGELASIHHQLNKLNCELVQKEQQISTVQSYHSYFVDFNLKKSALLNEDLLDLMTKEVDDQPLVKSETSEILANLYQISLENEQEIKQTAEIIEYIIAEIVLSSPEKIDLVDLLTELGVGKHLIIINNLLPTIASQQATTKYSGVSFRKLMTHLLQSILNYIEQVGSLVSINLNMTDGSIVISFICQTKTRELLAQDLTLFKCKAWAMANCASINLHYGVEVLVIELSLPAMVEEV